MSDISVVDVSGTLDREMAPSWKKVVARRHLVCGNCASWVHYETSGCEKKWGTQELRDSSSRARGAQRWRLWLRSVRTEADDGRLEGDCSRTTIG